MASNGMERGDPDRVLRKTDLLYGIEERPPWSLSILLAFQQFLMAATTAMLGPLIIAGYVCLSDDVLGTGEFMGTVIFIGGLSSLLQTTFGIRLPIVQGPSASFIAPIIMVMKSNQHKCPDFHSTEVNSTLPFTVGSDAHKALWKSNLTELQGALMVAAVVEVLIGVSGVVGILMRYIGPLTTSTVITLIGMSLIDIATIKGSSQWWICILTVFLIIVFSQYLSDITVPLFGGHRVKFFLLFPILLGIVIAWLVCFVLTESNVLSDKKGEWGYEARTDINVDALRKAPWFRFPYPGQWGIPTLTAGGVVAMSAAIFASTIESIGDYYACAKLCGVPDPPSSAISRGLAMEGICCILAGSWGTGCGFTSYSHNIASISLTKVGCRVVVQMAAVMMLVVGCVGKIGTLLSTIPVPIIGGTIYVNFGMVTAVGVASLATVDLQSTRNIFIFGFSIFVSLSLPKWVAQNPFSLGNETANEVLTVICSTSMLVGGAMACVMDNTMPGTLEERGILLPPTDTNTTTRGDSTAYDLPWIKPLLNRFKCLRYLPFCPGFIGDDASTSAITGTRPPSKKLDRKSGYAEVEIEINGSSAC